MREGISSRYEDKDSSFLYQKAHDVISERVGFCIEKLPEEASTRAIKYALDQQYDRIPECSAPPDSYPLLKDEISIEDPDSLVTDYLRKLGRFEHKGDGVDIPDRTPHRRAVDALIEAAVENRSVEDYDLVIAEVDILKEEQPETCDEVNISEHREKPQNRTDIDFVGIDLDRKFYDVVEVKRSAEPVDFDGDGKIDRASRQLEDARKALDKVPELEEFTGNTSLVQVVDTARANPFPSHYSEDYHLANDLERDKQETAMEIIEQFDDVSAGELEPVSLEAEGEDITAAI